MAAKKTTENETPITREKELENALAEMKKEKEALLKEMEALKGEPIEETESDYDADYWNEKVPYEAFYDGDRYADDISVKVNGKRFLIKRGVQVMIPRFVAHVLENQAKQLRYSADYNRSLQEEFERETKRIIGE